MILRQDLQTTNGESKAGQTSRRKIHFLFCSLDSFSFYFAPLASLSLDQLKRAIWMIIFNNERKSFTNKPHKLLVPPRAQHDTKSTLCRVPLISHSLSHNGIVRILEFTMRRSFFEKQFNSQGGIKRYSVETKPSIGRPIWSLTSHLSSSNKSGLLVDRRG